MPQNECKLETSEDVSEIHGKVLEALIHKGYKIQQDLNTKIVAKHSTSAMYYSHEVEVNLDYGQTGNTTITLRIDHRGSVVYLDRLVKELKKNLLSVQKQENKQLSSEVNKAILWQKNETLVNYLVAKEFFDKTQISGVRLGMNGFLVVTNQRILFACKLGILAKDYAITYGINLEDIMSVSPGKFGFNDKLIILEKSGQHKDFIQPKIYNLIPIINVAISEQRSLLEAQKAKERIQVVLDFSSLKDVMVKGGVVISSYNCPKCNAMVEIPEAGKVMICKYCGAPIKPVDIFDRIKSFLNP